MALFSLEAHVRNGEKFLFTKLMNNVRSSLSCKVGWFLGSVMFISSCTPINQPDNITIPTIITFGAPEGDRSLYRPLIQKFNTQYADLQVQFVSLDEALQSGNSTGSTYLGGVVSAADTAISIVQPADINNHSILDLTPYINADPAFDLSDYYPAALNSYSADGVIYTLPQTVYTQAFAYNKTRWVAAGLPAPGMDLTWDELLASAQQIKASVYGASTSYGLMDNGEAQLVLLHELEKADANLFELPAEQVQFDQPSVRAALQQTRALVKDGTVYTYAAQAQPITSFEAIARLIRAQQLFIWPTDVFPPTASDSKLGFDIGYIPIPKLAQPATLPGQTGYIITLAPIILMKHGNGFRFSASR